MFRILCFTTGQHIKIPSNLVRDINVKMPPDVRTAMGSKVTDLLTNYWQRPNDWEYVEFETEEAAKWFISHRLVYNPRRKDVSKVYFMEQLFKFNDIPGWETIKIEFEPDQV